MCSDDFGSDQSEKGNTKRIALKEWYLLYLIFHVIKKIAQWIFGRENVRKWNFQGHLKVTYFGEVRTVRYRVRQHDKRILLCVQDFELAEVSQAGRQRS